MKLINASLVGLIVIAMIFFAGCKKEEKVMPLGTPPAREIIIDATVPSAIYSNKKEIILNGSHTLALNGVRKLKFLWTCTSFPSGKQPAILYPESSSTDVINLDTGKYDFNLMVSDNLGNEANADYHLVVYPDTLTGPPVIPSLQDRILEMPQPVLLTCLNVFQSNPADRPLKFKWTLLEQPAGSPPVEITSPNYYISEVKGCVPGKYTFKLELTNELGLTTTGDIHITVIADNLAGTTRIYDNLAWTEIQDDMGGLAYIALTVSDPQVSFLYRKYYNTEVSLWDFEKQEWMAPNIFSWDGYPGGFILYNSLNLPQIKVNSPAKLRVKFL